MKKLKNLRERGIRTPDFNHSSQRTIPFRVSEHIARKVIRKRVYVTQTRIFLVSKSVLIIWLVICKYIMQDSLLPTLSLH